MLILFNRKSIDSHILVFDGVTLMRYPYQKKVNKLNYKVYFEQNSTKQRIIHYIMKRNSEKCSLK